MKLFNKILVQSRFSRVVLHPNVIIPHGLCLIELIDRKPALGGLEKDQALRNFLTATSDSKPAIMPSSQSGLVETGVAAGATGARIFDTLFEPEFAVYTFPSASSAIPSGLVPVIPRMSAVAVMANIRATEPMNMFVRVLIVAKEANTPRCGAVVSFIGSLVPD